LFLSVPQNVSQVLENTGKGNFDPHRPYQWIAPPAFKWNYARFAKPRATAPAPDETFEMTFAKDNAAEEGFNRWTINGVAYPMTSK
jgi:hypothetical protein